MEEKISIIIPVYNAGNFIVRCLDSIMRQTYTNYEVLIIDDRGADNSVEIIKKYLSENPGFNAKLIHNPENLGVSEARNMGIRKATGKFVFFIDADDSLAEERTLAKFLEKHRATRAEVIFGATNFYRNNQKIIYPYHENKVQKNQYSGVEILESFLKGEWPSVVWNKLYLRSFLDEHKLYFYPGIVHEDELFCFSFSAAAGNIAFIEDRTYNYYSLDNPTSITGNISLKNHLDMQKVLFQMMKISAEKNLPEKSPKTVPFLQNFAMNAILARLLHNKKIWKKVYNEIGAEFVKYHFPNQKYFKKPAFLAYPAYKSRYDSSYKFYKKFPEIFARLL